MDPYIPPVTPGTSASNDSESAEDAKHDQRHHEKMQAFKQAIERTRLTDPTTALSQASSLPQPKTPTTPTPRKLPTQLTSTDFQLPEGAELPEEFASLKQETPPPPQPKSTPQAPLDPAYRQALLRMQSEGVRLPGSLLDLLEESEPPKPPGAKTKTSTEELPDQPTESVDQEPTDPESAARHAQAKSAAFSDTDTHSGSASSDKSKHSSTDSTDTGSSATALPLQQAFTPQVPPTPTPQRVPPPPPLVQQLVEFATFTRNEAGFLEFRLGLTQDALGGLRIQLASYGNRRVGLKVKGASGQPSTIGDPELAGLIEALRAKNIEVVEVVRE